jgi:hypothetical protein
MDSLQILTKNGFVDTLSLSNLLKNAKDSDKRAEIIADAVRQSQEIMLSKKDALEKLASKEDLRKLELKTIEEIRKLEIGTVEEIKKLEIGTVEEIKKLEIGTVEEIKKLELSTNKEIKKLETQMSYQGNKILLVLISALLGLAALIKI